MFGERFLILTGLKHKEPEKAEAVVAKAYNDESIEEYVNKQERLADMLSDGEKKELPFKLPENYRF